LFGLFKESNLHKSPFCYIVAHEEIYRSGMALSLNAENNKAACERLGRLQKNLDARATAKSRNFWQKYLKGRATFRGVPMNGIRETVHAWWRDEGLHNLSIATQKQIALRLFEEEHTEDKLAGVLAFSEILLPHLSKKDLPAFERLFASTHISDWNLCDWFCIKVLGKMVEQSPDSFSLAKTISAWRTSRPLWQRRASCVAFVNHAKHGDKVVPGLPDILIKNCEALVRDSERFAQTGAGWVLRELSLHDKPRVIQFAKNHAKLLSREGIKRIVEKMPADDKKRLLDFHDKRGDGAKKR